MFYTIHDGDILPIHCKMNLSRPKTMSKVDGLSLILINFYVPALTPHLNSSENLLQLSKNTILFAVCRIYMCRCHQQRDLGRPQVVGAYHLYIDCTMWRTGRNM
jgi:hypothetical protein